jgi:hypothetical protein
MMEHDEQEQAHEDSIAVCVKFPTDFQITNEMVSQAAGIDGVQSAEKRDAPYSNCMCIHVPDKSLAKSISSQVARMFPGVPIEWGSCHE